MALWSIRFVVDDEVQGSIETAMSRSCTIAESFRCAGRADHTDKGATYAQGTIRPWRRTRGLHDDPDTVVIPYYDNIPQRYARYGPYAGKSHNHLATTNP